MSLSDEDSPSDGPPSDPDPVPLYPEDVKFFFSEIKRYSRKITSMIKFTFTIITYPYLRTFLGFFSFYFLKFWTG